MQKTTVYLPAELKTALRCMARDTGISEAELIRQAVGEKVLLRHPRPRPSIPLTGRGLGDPEAADRVDALLAGFGCQ
ncbi:MAG: ribbon-helix-helix domain-containing protein [Bryobacterales bacterium]|nr:ribbon-helix-helix domain-containing protein [Bryobacterales bacterium]